MNVRYYKQINKIMFNLWSYGETYSIHYARKFACTNGTNYRLEINSVVTTYVDQ